MNQTDCLRTARANWSGSSCSGYRSPPRSAWRSSRSSCRESPRISVSSFLRSDAEGADRAKGSQCLELGKWLWTKGDWRADFRRIPPFESALPPFGAQTRKEPIGRKETSLWDSGGWALDEWRLEGGFRRMPPIESALPPFGSFPGYRRQSLMLRLFLNWGFLILRMRRRSGSNSRGTRAVSACAG